MAERERGQVVPPDQSEAPDVWYKVSPGFTHPNGVADEGSLPIHHRDMGEGFQPLSPKEQMRRWGRVMYEPTDAPEELEEEVEEEYGNTLAATLPTPVPVGLPHGEVQKNLEVDPNSQPEDDESNQVETRRTTRRRAPVAVEEVDFSDKNDDELRQMASNEGLDFPPETPRRNIEGALRKRLQERSRG